MVDFDVHHGNGSQVAFYARPALFYASSHQWPLHPGTGERSETSVSGNIVNLPLPLPLPPGCDSALFRNRIEVELLPALRAFRPDFLIISLGFDAHRLVPLAGMQLEDDDFGWITERLMAVADPHCAGRIVSVLEGGYSAAGLAGATAARVEALIRQ